MDKKMKYYDILKAKPNSSLSELKKAYFKQAKKFHPDRNPTGKHEFHEICQAYRVLSSVAQDRGDVGVGSHPLRIKDKMRTFFISFCDETPNILNPNESIYCIMEVSLSELYLGAERDFHLTLCNNCHVAGWAREIICGICLDEGFSPVAEDSELFCKDCNAEGVFYTKSDCQNCHGQKMVEVVKVLKIKLEPGMEDGDKITFKGVGVPKLGFEACDITIQLKQLKHPVFTRDSCDLSMVFDVTPQEQLTKRYHKIIATLDGRCLKVITPSNDSSFHGAVRYIPGEGMPYACAPSYKGRLILTINFMKEMPDEMEEKTKTPCGQD